MNFLKLYIHSLIMCFFQMQLRDDPPSATKEPPVTDPKDLPKSVDEFTIEDIKGIMKEVAKESTKEQMLNLKKEMVDVHRKSIFPEVEGEFGEGGAEAAGGSIVDTNVFHKNYGGAPTQKDMASAVRWEAKKVMPIPIDEMILDYVDIRLNGITPPKNST